MITKRIADFLAEYRPFATEITLYGATRQTYDALTQIPPVPTTGASAASAC
jgi:hypothetical protein